MVWQSAYGYAKYERVLPDVQRRRILCALMQLYRGADKSLARPGRKQATATEDFDLIYPIYNHNWRNISTIYIYRGADKSLARPGRKQATATEDFEFHISYL